MHVTVTGPAYIEGYPVNSFSDGGSIWEGIGGFVHRYASPSLVVLSVVGVGFSWRRSTGVRRVVTGWTSAPNDQVIVSSAHWATTGAFTTATTTVQMGQLVTPGNFIFTGASPYPCSDDSFYLVNGNVVGKWTISTATMDWIVVWSGTAQSAQPLAGGHLAVVGFSPYNVGVFGPTGLLYTAPSFLGVLGQPRGIGDGSLLGSSFSPGTGQYRLYTPSGHTLRKINRTLRSDHTPFAFGGTDNGPGVTIDSATTAVLHDSVTVARVATVTDFAATSTVIESDTWSTNEFNPQAGVIGPVPGGFICTAENLDGYVDEATSVRPVKIEWGGSVQPARTTVAMRNLDLPLARISFTVNRIKHGMAYYYPNQTPNASNIFDFAIWCRRRPDGNINLPPGPTDPFSWFTPNPSTWFANAAKVTNGDRWPTGQIVSSLGPWRYATPPPSPLAWAIKRDVIPADYTLNANTVVHQTGYEEQAWIYQGDDVKFRWRMDVSALSRTVTEPPGAHGDSAVSTAWPHLSPDDYRTVTTDDAPDMWIERSPNVKGRVTYRIRGNLWASGGFDGATPLRFHSQVRFRNFEDIDMSVSFLFSEGSSYLRQVQNAPIRQGHHQPVGLRQGPHGVFQ